MNKAKGDPIGRGNILFVVNGTLIVPHDCDCQYCEHTQIQKIVNKLVLADTEKQAKQNAANFYDSDDYEKLEAEQISEEMLMRFKRQPELFQTEE